MHIEAQSENFGLNSRIKPRMYERRSTMYLLAGTGVRKRGTVASGFSPIKTHYFDYPKRFFTRLNKVYDFSKKYSDILLKKHKLHL